MESKLVKISQTPTSLQYVWCCVAGSGVWCGVTRFSLPTTVLQKRGRGTEVESESQP